jgi:hypothetical protein
MVLGGEAGKILCLRDGMDPKELWPGPTPAAAEAGTAIKNGGGHQEL